MATAVEKEEEEIGCNGELAPFFLFLFLASESRHLCDLARGKDPRFSIPKKGKTYPGTPKKVLSPYLVKLLFLPTVFFQGRTPSFPFSDNFKKKKTFSGCQKSVVGRSE